MPLPAIEDVFQKLGDSALFCVMDITKGFWNVPISPESQKYTAFTLRNIGLFEYLVMPMGLKNLPATFARLCELVFPSQDFKEFLQCFLDDLCIFCKDFKALLPALDKVSWSGSSSPILNCTRASPIWLWRRSTIWGIPSLKGGFALAKRSRRRFES
jgi:hypothetical protein